MVLTVVLISPPLDHNCYNRFPTNVGWLEASTSSDYSSGIVNIYQGQFQNSEGGKAFDCS